MSPHNEALKLLLESGITHDLKDIEMTYRIATVLENVIQERNVLREERTVANYWMKRNNEMKNSIMNLLNDKIVATWEGDDDE